MEKIDLRKATDRERELLCKQVMALRKKCKKNLDFSGLLGLSMQTTSRRWQWSLQASNKMLSVPKRDRKTRDKRTLSTEQEKAIQKIINDHCPDQPMLPFALWDRQSILMLIKLKFGIQIPMRTVGQYLSRWCYTPQKPLRKAYEQRTVEVERLMQELFPELKTKAKSEQTEIYWGEDAGISTNINLVRGYAPSGKTMVLRMDARKEHISMMSAISNRGKLRFMLYEGEMNYQRLI